MDLNISQIWDMLQVTLHPDDGGSVSMNYDRETLAVGDKLLSDRRVYGVYLMWPEVEVVDFDDFHISLKLLFGNGTTEEMELNVNSRADIHRTRIDSIGIRGVMIFSLHTFSVRIDEYDPIEDVTKQLYIDDKDLCNALEGDAEAAQSVADSVAEQVPESLEIIAKYMELAAENGSKDAADWLYDYYRGDDGRYDAYV